MLEILRAAYLVDMSYHFHDTTPLRWVAGDR
jgi:hypothetical protein